MSETGWVDGERKEKHGSEVVNHSCGAHPSIVDTQ